jgi:lipoate synthase
MAPAPEGRRLLRLEVRNAATPIEKKREWIRTRARLGPQIENLILGMGETREEVSQALVDLHVAGCELVTITQCLRPSLRHHPVERWVRPEEFVELQDEATEIGFAGVLSGPLARSSYRAGRLYQQALASRVGT